MRPPDRYSASPWYSFVTITTTQHVPSFAETVRRIVAWLRGVQPGWRQQAKEARIIEALVAEMEEDAAIDGTNGTNSQRKTTGEGHGATTT